MQRCRWGRAAPEPDKESTSRATGWLYKAEKALGLAGAAIRVAPNLEGLEEQNNFPFMRGRELFNESAVGKGFIYNILIRRKGLTMAECEKYFFFDKLKRLRETRRF